MKKAEKLDPKIVALRSLLVAVGIRRVVCVDDKHGLGVQFGDIVTWATQNLEHSALRSALDGLALDPKDPNFGEDLRAELEEDTNLALRTRLEPVVESSGLLDDVVALKELDELLNDARFEYLKLKPEEWNARKQELIADALSGGVMFLFDQDLGSDKPLGVDFIRETTVLAEDGKSKLHLGLLSHGIPEDGEQEWMEQKGFTFDVGVTPISKKGITKPDNLGRRLKVTLLRPGCRELQNAVIAALQKSHQEVVDQISKLYELAFDQAVLQASEHEGAWEPDAVIRLYEAMIRNRARKELRESGEVDAVLPMIREMSGRLSKVRLSQEDPRISHSTSYLQRMERFDGGEFINGSRLPIEIGDIFEDHQGRYFILVAPQCDLMVRSDGKRKVSEGTLIEIVDVAPSQREREERMKVELKCFHASPQKAAWADFRQATSVKLWVLDLCAFNVDGRAAIDVGLPVPTGHTKGWTECYRHVLQAHATPAFRELATLERSKLAVRLLRGRSIAGCGSRKLSTDLKKIQGSLCTATNRDLFPVRRTKRGLEFSLRRKDRLVASLAYDLYRAFHAYLNRAVEEMPIDSLK